MKFKFTDKQKKQLGFIAYDYHNSTWTNDKIKEEKDKRRQEIHDLGNSNTDKLNVLDACYFGPYSAREILKDVELRPDVLPGDYINALEDVLGTSTKMVYNKDKKTFSAKTPNNGDKLVYDEKDVELGLWDKICAFFGIKTDHAKKVEFAKNSIQVQKDKLSDLNKKLLKWEQDEFVEEHKPFAERNEAILKEAEKTEDGLKKLFFGDEKVPNYEFKNGAKITALSACIAMYHQIGDKDIAKMSLEEIKQDVNLRVKLKEIGAEYKAIVSEKGLDEKLKYLDDFLFTSDKYTTRDKALLSRIATDKPFEIDWDKAERNVQDKNQKKELAGAKSLAMLKVKAQVGRILGGKLSDGKESGYGQLNDTDKKYFGAYKDVELYKLFMEEMSKVNYEKAYEHLGKMTNKVKELEGFEMKPENYGEFLNKAESNIKQHEKNLLIKTTSEIQDEMTWK